MPITTEVQADPGTEMESAALIRTAGHSVWCTELIVLAVSGRTGGLILRETVKPVPD